MANLMEGLLKELDRVKEIKKQYDSIPEGIFGAAMIKLAIVRAEKSIIEGDVVAMITSCRELQEIE